MKITWRPIGTHPMDGVPFLGLLENGDVATFNKPPGYQIGRWHLINGSWRGQVAWRQPEWWAPMPDCQFEEGGAK